MKNPKLCWKPHCRRRKGKRTGGLCYMHQKRAWRARNPMQAAYSRLRESARERRIKFALPFEYFEAFATASDLLNRTGNGGDCLTVDRKNNRKGYIVGNIQAITRRANSIKRGKQDERRYLAGYRWREAA